jgi:hypothetical protein
MRKFILLFLLFIGVTNSPNQPPNQWQDAIAVWLSNKIYLGIDKMDTDNGYVFHSYVSELTGAYALWIGRNINECYIVIRGTNSLGDIFTDLDVAEFFDEEIKVRVHSGVRKRALFILNNIGNKLKICTEDIIITGHSLGGSISYYLYLLYVKRHLEDWNEQSKASRFKAVLFGTPALTTKSSKENLANFDNYVNWYKYGRDGIPFIIGIVQGSLLFDILTRILADNLIYQIKITRKAYEIVQNVNYGYYHPGHKYHLIKGKKIDYAPELSGIDSEAIKDHIDLYKSVDILTQIWYTTNQFNDINNISKIDCVNFLNDDNEKLSDEIIDINTADCEDVTGYTLAINFTNAILYLNKDINDPSSYIIKRLLNNEKEYEYAMCIDKKFILKQCDGKCQCHEVLKNDRPKEISHCNNYQFESSMNCLVDGKPKEIDVYKYFSIINEIKIDDYYLMDYFCYNQTYSRGNYKIEGKNNSLIIIKVSLLSIIFLLLL